ncbi:LysR substrate-binding domain-containing protein [Pleomorphomonas oryzae]|uniref:LysR substrate-binding domain-containing protein n=1 Tax=Pleomorphomonas oryzae TaxID=261934 RepID=UPI0003FD5888|nr:LysR substrate-binding domain-containing protein [Pleomorphomonas oryzae]
MDISQLRTFALVADLGSLNKASGRLRIAQPALSRQIRLMEEELGVRLFERHGRGMRLTDHGIAALDHARHILGELEDMRAAVGGPEAGMVGSVSVGLSPTISNALSVPLVAAFRQAHPAVRVRIVTSYTGYLLDSLFRGDIDAAILYSARANQVLRTEPILSENLFLIGPVSADLSPERPVEFRELAALPLLLPSRGHDLRAVVEDCARQAGIDIDVVVEVDGYGSLKELVGAGYGYTIMPATAFEREPTAGDFRRAPLVNPAPVRQLALCYPRDRRVSRAALFAGEVMKEKMIGLVREGTWNGTLLTEADRP